MLMIDPNYARNLYSYYTYVASEWYESLTHLIPTPEFLGIARSALPLSWSIYPNGVWTYASPPHERSLRQGWKIHVSAMPENCEQILEKCTEICVRHEVPFKFLTDSFVFSTVISKGGAREESGKFITIYPLDIHHFRSIADDLCQALAEFKGPYVLSDMRYKESQVVYYRYGAFMGYQKLSIFGNTEIFLQDPNGTLVQDGRSPFFNPPSWMPDPFDSDEFKEDEIETTADSVIYLKDGKYRIETPIHFSLSGGVYRAVDMDTCRTVIIKEARPYTSIAADGMDAVRRLEKEYRLLKKLSRTQIAPEPLDLFKDWEHLFLVQEFIEGEDLYTLTARSEWETERQTTKDKRKFTEGLYTIWAELANAFKIAHEHNIVINDVSPGNVIISHEEEKLRLIDLEGAWEIGVDTPDARFGTTGYRPRGGVHGALDDIYGLGRIVCSMLFPGNMLLNVKPTAKHIFLDLAERDGILSGEMKTLLLECLESEENARPSAGEIFNRLEKISLEAKETRQPLTDIHNVMNTDSIEITQKLLKDTVDGILRYIKSNMSLDRTDRLFPADPAVFSTNPLSVAHGAAGVAYTLKSLEGEVPEQVMTWMLAQDISPEKYTPGLYLGISGIAWVYWKLGLENFALQLMEAAAEHPLLWELPDIYYGVAGFGLACLFFYKETQDAYWLEQAAKVGDWLIDTKTVADECYYWPDMEGNVWCGYARGQSGIALFFLYLFLTSGESRFQAAGRNALAYDLSHVKADEHGLQITRATPDSVPSVHQNVASHYWADGSAGVCTSLVRYWFVFKDNTYKEILDGLLPDTYRDQTPFPTLFTGLAGLANLQLDVFDFTNDTQYVKQAHQITEGIFRFQLQKPNGVAFPGEQLLRISTDFGSGAAGIALFLSRLANQENKFQNFNFLLDDLLCQKK